MADDRKYKIVEIDTVDRSQVFIDGGIERAYSLDDWDHVLILQVGANFNINANAGMIRKSFGYGSHRPVIFTRSPIKFFRVEAVDVEKMSWWERLKAWFSPSKR